jgi:hypothetical protein
METSNLLEFYNIDEHQSLEKMKLLRKEIKAKDKKIKREKKELRRLLRQTQEIDARLKKQEKINRAKYQEARSKRKREKKAKKQTKYQKKQQKKSLPKETKNILTEVRSAFEQNISEMKYTNRTDTDNQDTIQRDITRDLQPRIQNAITRFGEVRIQFGVGIVLRNQDGESIDWYHTNVADRVTALTDIITLVRQQMVIFLNAVIDSEFEGSGWAIDYITFVNVQIIRNPNMRASSQVEPKKSESKSKSKSNSKAATLNLNMQASSYIETPQFIKSKSAVINIKNDQDNECFKWCILAHLYPIDGKKHPCNISHYKKIQDHNLKFEEFPMKLSSIPKFEEKNSISVSVYGYSIEGLNESFYPLYNSQFKYEKHVELLYLESENLDDNKKKKYHYALIRNFGRLVNKAVNAKAGAIICRKCMVPFYTQVTFDKHTYFCINTQPQCVMPKDGDNILKFKNTTYSLRHPFDYICRLRSYLSKRKWKISSYSTFCSISSC